jgi:hypothetical protein
MTMAVMAAAVVNFRMTYRIKAEITNNKYANI